MTYILMHQNFQILKLMGNISTYSIHFVNSRAGATIITMFLLFSTKKKPRTYSEKSHFFLRMLIFERQPRSDYKDVDSIRLIKIEPLPHRPPPAEQILGKRCVDEIFQMSHATSY